MPTWLTNLLGGGIIDKLLSFIPNPEARAQAERELRAALLDAAIKGESEQREINKVEAANASLFVAGWRPAVGWLCVATLAYQWIIAPTVSWAFVAAGHDLTPLPVLGKDDAQVLLYALLGLGGLRTLDKLGGSDTRAIVGRLPFLADKRGGLR